MLKGSKLCNITREWHAATLVRHSLQSGYGSITLHENQGHVDTHD